MSAAVAVVASRYQNACSTASTVRVVPCSSAPTSRRCFPTISPAPPTWTTVVPQWTASKNTGTRPEVNAQTEFTARTCGQRSDSHGRKSAKSAGRSSPRICRDSRLGHSPDAIRKNSPTFQLLGRSACH